jgi:hypothetical protein
MSSQWSQYKMDGNECASHSLPSSASLVIDKNTWTANDQIQNRNAANTMRLSEIQFIIRHIKMRFINWFGWLYFVWEFRRLLDKSFSALNRCAKWLMQSCDVILFACRKQSARFECAHHNGRAHTAYRLGHHYWWDHGFSDLQNNFWLKFPSFSTTF